MTERLAVDPGRDREATSRVTERLQEEVAVGNDVVIPRTAAVPDADVAVVASVNEVLTLSAANVGDSMLWVALVLALGLAFLAAFAALRSIGRLRVALNNLLRRDPSTMPTPSGPLELSTPTEELQLVTDQLRAQLARAKHSEQRYRMLFEANPQPMWLHDHRTGAFLAANEAFTSAFGLGADESHALHVHDLFPEDGTEQALGNALMSEDRVDRSGPWRLVRPDGSHVDCLISCETMHLSDHVGRLVVVEDVTEARQAQGALARADRLESLGQLAGGIAHDFNNVLAVISNFSSFVGDALEDAAVEHPERWETAIDDNRRVTDAAERAAALVQQLLSFAGSEPIAPALVDLNDAARGVSDVLRGRFDAGVEIALSLTSDLCYVRGDLDQLHEVLLTLTVNAAEAMADGGRVVIETENIVLEEPRDALEPGRYVRLRVTDTGSGMPPHVRDRAFEPFFTTKVAGKGTGLALAAVYGVVSAMRGVVTLDSEPGVGTVATVLLPAEDDEPQSEDGAADVRRAPWPARILIVDDEEGMRSSAQRILQGCGYEVQVAASGEEAEVLVASSPTAFHVVLTDVVMPGLSGVQLASRVRSSNPGLPVIFMSGFTQDILRSGDALREVPLLEKPFTASTLAAAIHRALTES